MILKNGHDTISETEIIFAYIKYDSHSAMNVELFANTRSVVGMERKKGRKKHLGECRESTFFLFA